MYTEALALDWHRPDNSANLFAAVACENDPHVFRLSIELADEVHPKLLQKALGDTLPYFRAFNVSYIRGFFGGRFKAQVQPPPQVQADTGYICRYFQWGEGFLFRVLYEGRKFHLEASHALTDGTGGLYFLKAVACRYIQLAYGQDLPEQYRKERFGLEEGMDILDGYAKNYRKVKCSEHRLSQAYQLSGERRTVGDIGMLSMEMSVRELKEVSKRHHATISEYLSAVILKALADGCPDSMDKIIRIELPVNLRTIFQTETALNFFSNIGIELLPEQFTLSFDEIINVVKTQFQEKIRKEKFEQRFGISVWGERCLIGQIAPLKARDWFLRLMYKLCGRTSTLGFSNLGRIDLEPAFSSYIRGISGVASPTPDVPVKIVACSVNDRFRMNITTKLVDMTCPEKITEALRKSGVKRSRYEQDCIDGDKKYLEGAGGVLEA